MATCTYDNPATMQRECWIDGKLIYACSFKILQPYAKSPPPEDILFFGGNVGDWESGRLIGDIKAMDKAE